MKTPRVSSLALLCLALSTTVISCKKEDLVSGGQPAAAASDLSSSDTTGASAGSSSAIAAAMASNSALAAASVSSTTTTLPAFALPYSLSVNWSNRSNGDYTLAQANADFGPTAYWQGIAAQSQAYNGMLRTTLLKNALSSGGVLSKIDIPDATMYRLNFDMQFAPDFDFSQGGKVGFGLLIGNGYTGSTMGTDGNGGSFRLAWGKNAAGAVVLKPNVYYKDQTAADGNDFGKQFPASGSIQKGVWYKVSMSVTSNSGSNTNGNVQLTINGVSVLNQAIRWTTNDAKRFVSNICLETLRGGVGAGTSYQSATDGNILFDNVVVKSLSMVGPSATTSTSGSTSTGSTSTGSTSPTGTTGTTSPTTTTTGISTRSVNWDGRPNGNYGLTQAIADFGNANYYQLQSASQSQVYNGMLKTTLLANSLTNGGVLTRSNITPGSQYELNFDMQFASNFDFSWGGKVGYGLFIGDGNTGGDPAWDGNGGSVRLMWYKNTSTSPVILKPYVYYKDQPGTYGNDFGKVYPSGGASIQKGVWYHVKMLVKSNTGSNTDGRVQIVINGTTVLDQAIRWTTNDAKRLINTLCFETFRGGAETYWQSSSNGDIYFDNVKLVQLAL